MRRQVFLTPDQRDEIIGVITESESEVSESSLVCFDFSDFRKMAVKTVRLEANNGNLEMVTAPEHSFGLFMNEQPPNFTTMSLGGVTLTEALGAMDALGHSKASLKTRTMTSLLHQDVFLKLIDVTPWDNTDIAVSFLGLVGKSVDGVPVTYSNDPGLKFMSEHRLHAPTQEELERWELETEPDTIKWFKYSEGAASEIEQLLNDIGKLQSPTLENV